MKKFRGLVLLLVVGMAITGCYMTPDMGDVELSLVLPKTLLEKAPPGYIMKIVLLQDGALSTYSWKLPVPSYDPDPEKKSSGVLALKVPIGINYQIRLDIGTGGVDDWTSHTTGTSERFNVESYTGNVKVEITLY